LYFCIVPNCTEIQNFQLFTHVLEDLQGRVLHHIRQAQALTDLVDLPAGRLHLPVAAGLPVVQLHEHVELPTST
jgi:hypothetical protein